MRSELGKRQGGTFPVLISFQAMQIYPDGF